MHFKISIRLLFFLLSVQFCFSQENEGVLEELLLEQISEELGENVDISEISERLYYLLRHPLDLNEVSEAELTNLIFLSPQQVANIIAHREQTGDFINILELQGVVGLDLQTIQWLRQFVRVVQKSTLKDLSWKEVRKADEHMLMLRYSRTLENQQGYHITIWTRITAVEWIEFWERSLDWCRSKARDRITLVFFDE